MSYDTNISESVDEEWWNNLLLQNHISSIYQTTNWLKVYQDAYGSKPFFISVKDNEENIVGQLACLLHDEYFWEHSNYFSKILGKKLGSKIILNWNYGPIIHNSDNYEKIVEKILDAIEIIAKKNKVIMIRGSSSPLSEKHAQNQFKALDYEVTEWQTYIVNLHQDPEIFLKNLDKKIRYDIRKSIESNLEFEIANKRTDLTELTEMGIEARSKMGDQRKLNTKRLDSDWKNLYANGYLKVFLARSKKKLVSGIWNMIFNGNVIQHGVANSTDSTIRGGTFLTVNSIKWCIENNLLTYDMGGANPSPVDAKEKNIDFYKSKWDSKKHSYYIYTKLIDKRKWQILQAIKKPKKAYTRITNSFKNSRN